MESERDKRTPNSSSGQAHTYLNTHIHVYTHTCILNKRTSIHVYILVYLFIHKQETALLSDREYNFTRSLIFLTESHLLFHFSFILSERNNDGVLSTIIYFLGLITESLGFLGIKSLLKGNSVPERPFLHGSSS